jgi:hypothetical protein
VFSQPAALPQNGQPNTPSFGHTVGQSAGKSEPLAVNPSPVFGNIFTPEKVFAQSPSLPQMNGQAGTPSFGHTVGQSAGAAVDSPDLNLMQDPDIISLMDHYRRGGLPEAAGRFIGGLGQAAVQAGNEVATGYNRFGNAVEGLGNRFMAGLTDDLNPLPQATTDKAAAPQAVPTPEKPAQPSPALAQSATPTSPVNPNLYGTYGGTPVFTLPGSNAFADKENIATLNSGQAALLPQQGQAGFGNPVITNKANSQQNPQALPFGRSAENQAQIEANVAAIRGPSTAQTPLNPTLSNPPRPQRGSLPSPMAGFDLQKAMSDAESRAQQIERDSFNATGGRGVTRAAQAAAAAIRAEPANIYRQLIQSQLDLQGKQLNAAAHQGIAQTQAEQAAQRQALESQKFQAEQAQKQRTEQRNKIKDIATIQKPINVLGPVDPTTGMASEQTVQFNPQTGRYEAFRLPPTLQQFISAAKADPRNKNLTDQDLTSYFYQTYGR